MSFFPRSSRQYAELVIAEPFPSEVKALMDRCPPEWCASVELIVASHERRVAEYVRQKEKLRPKDGQSSPRLGAYKAAETVRGDPVIAARSLAGIRASLQSTQESH